MAFPSNTASRQPRALITGITGFTGRYMQQELLGVGYEVFGTARESSHSSNIYSLDLHDKQAVSALVESVLPDVVIHLAAIAFVAHGDVDDIYRTNIVATHHLLSALAQCRHKPRAVLLASSANVYGNVDSDGCIDEETVLSPANDYAVSKSAMEQMASLWQQQLPIVITRPFNYTGVGQSAQFLLPKIVKHFQQNKRVIELGNTDVQRDFSDVRMVVNSYRRLLDREVSTFEVYNVCSGKVYSLQNVLDIMAEIAGYEIEVQVNPAFVRSNEVKKLQGDNGKLTAVIGETDSIALRDTLSWMYEKGHF